MRGSARRHSARSILIVAFGALLCVSATAAASAAPHAGFFKPHALVNHVILNGSTLSHAAPGGSEPLTKPDDITFLYGHIFVAFQNGVGPQGEPSATQNVDSTVVELTPFGRPIAQWDIDGKCDGLTADPWTGAVIATVNEDANSSLYTIDPIGGTVTHYFYSPPPPSDGGTDAISVDHGMILISGSAPGTTGTPVPSASPAVYQVDLDSATHVASISPLFFDGSSATVANAGAGGSVTLALTDPDSNSVVPWYAERFGGDFMLTGQADQQQVFVNDPGTSAQTLSVLNLSSSIDDTVWPSFLWGGVYATDNGADTVNLITGRFDPGAPLVAVTPCDQSNAPTTCPGPGFPANYLGALNPWTGAITPVTVHGPVVHPQGLLFLP